MKQGIAGVVAAALITGCAAKQQQPKMSLPQPVAPRTLDSLTVFTPPSDGSEKYSVVLKKERNPYINVSGVSCLFTIYAGKREEKVSSLVYTEVCSEDLLTSEKNSWQLYSVRDLNQDKMGDKECNESGTFDLSGKKVVGWKSCSPITTDYPMKDALQYMVEMVNQERAIITVIPEKK